MLNRKRVTGIIFILGLISSIVPLIPAPVYTPLEFDDNLDIMTYNLHFGINNDGQYSLEDVVDVLVEYQPDVLFVQEITVNAPVNGFINLWADLVAVTQQLGYGSNYLSDGELYLYNGIISRYPLSEALTVRYDAQDTYQRTMIEGKIEINNSDVVLATTHLSHSSENTRNLQTEELVELLDRYTLPVILGGDFNLVMTDDTYQLLGSQYQDSWLVSSATGTGLTNPTSDPNRRIDYLFASDDFGISNCMTIETSASDHLPVQCTYSL